MLQKKRINLKSEDANSMVENVIILPLIFIVIYFMLLMSFVMHDRATLDAAAKRGTIFAAKCISDPNYASILQRSGHDAGDLDTSVAIFNANSFDGVGNNIEPYRYFAMDVSEIENDTLTEVNGSINKTKLPWREIRSEDITVDINNYVIYQDVKVSITARYPLPAVFGAFGLPTDYVYTVEAMTAVNDPDEFIRNVDLIIDMVVMIDDKTGNHLSKLTSKISDMGTKLKEFLTPE